jgi:hypothetical protein
MARLRLVGLTFLFLALYLHPVSADQVIFTNISCDCGSSSCSCPGTCGDNWDWYMCGDVICPDHGGSVIGAGCGAPGSLWCACTDRE